MQEQATYRVKLPVFEGPLDLLLYLIRKNELDIYDIPVSLVVKQYMEYLDLMRSLDLDVAGEFLVMAATLSQIKSQMMLPGEPGEEEEEGEDPRAELVKRLLDYQRYKEAAEELMARPVLGREVFVRDESTEAIEEAAECSGIESVRFAEVGIFELLSAFKEVMERAQVTDWHEVTMERVSIMDRINWMLEKLKEVETLSFDQLFTHVTDKAVIIATFLAILELIRLKVVKAAQEKQFDNIYLVRAVEIDDAWIEDNLPKINRETV